MTKEEYQDFTLRYKGCGACFPLYEKLNRFEKMWFTAIQKDVFELEKAYNEAEELLDKQIEETYKLFEENVELKAKIEKLKCCQNCKHHYWLYEELSCRIHKIDVDTCNSWEMKND